MQLERACAFLFLLGNALWDIRTKQICLPYTIAFAVIGCGLSIAGGRELTEILAAISPGVFMIGLSTMTGGMVGGGDGIVLLALGLYLDLIGILLSCSAAFFLSIFPAGMLLMKKGKASTSFPFLPFLLAGFLFFISQFPGTEIGL